MITHFAYSLPTLSELRELGYSTEAVAEYPGYFAAAQKSDRLVLSGKKYSSNKARTWLAQGKCCARCPKPIVDPREAHAHHPQGRGMGGGKRDDRRIEVVCHGCHAKEKIERRETWIAIPPARKPAAKEARGLFLVKGGAA